MGNVSIVVIVYNDAARVVGAVESALAQGPEVGEVIVVDDCSTDGTLDALQPLTADPRLRLLLRETNSGGCGTPRNDGLAAAAFPYVLFLDSDDVLPPGAVRTLLTIAEREGADVVAGQCLRRELPDGPTTVWAPKLYDRSAGADLPGTVLAGIEERPEFLWDTLSVNKLYRRKFLIGHAITFPDGAFHYEDFVFTARVYAADPRLAVTDELVYIWHVRRQAAKLSISLSRGLIKNWQHRVTAHRGVVEVLRAAGRDELALHAQAKFADYDVPLYLRELPQRGEEYVADWWRITRDHLAGFDAEGIACAGVVSRWIAAAILASPEPAGLSRLVELTARPPRLAPPYDPAAPPVGLGLLATAELPVAVDGRVRAGGSTRLSLRVHELYGRLAELGPRSIHVELEERTHSRPLVGVEAPLVPDGDGWTADIRLSTGDLACAGKLGVWNVRAEIRYADGGSTPVEVRASDDQSPRRGIVVRPTGRVLLVQTHITGGRALVLRVADGMQGARRVAEARMRRLLGR
ncbi:glycosyltransferase family 2 protein [Streptomyces sp. H10-C2]|uniref:glycosyltransferase family 2 protein n=1 Tax=unclassified Streptomyces TaxID=2593676 RepID=UPI0024BAC8FC|nr:MULTISPECIES: glycosyltransferase family 2 protein [unclassified Streptomyces]MDJ0340152.1 glycosyltransferase family 2 protein [Streptomyces sp. PH10-H1]MDJ0369211.1 glycosyltransferase family 2 protein [Streptomyces sp. H10-C2]